MLPKAKKAFGQNFLVDQTVVQKILRATELTAGELVVEIGSGTGVLTQALVSSGAQVITVEKDQDLIPLLDQKFRHQLTLIQGDILTAECLATVAKHLAHRPFKVVANIPYNITSPLLKQLLTHSPKPTRLALMLQKEVAERITALPPRMSVLSVMCQLYAHCTRVALVKAGAFRPIPKVDSFIVRLDVYDPAHPYLQGLDPEQVIAFAKRGFAAKRKQLKTTLGVSITPFLEQLGLDPRVRAEALSVEQWIDLVRYTTRYNCTTIRS